MPKRKRSSEEQARRLKLRKRVLGRALLKDLSNALVEQGHQVINTSIRFSTPKNQSIPIGQAINVRDFQQLVSEEVAKEVRRRMPLVMRETVKEAFKEMLKDKAYDDIVGMLREIK